MIQTLIHGYTTFTTIMRGIQIVTTYLKINKIIVLFLSYYIYNKQTLSYISLALMEMFIASLRYIPYHLHQVPL